MCRDGKCVHQMIKVGQNKSGLFGFGLISLISSASGEMSRVWSSLSFLILVFSLKPLILRGPEFHLLLYLFYSVLKQALPDTLLFKHQIVIFVGIFLSLCLDGTLEWKWRCMEMDNGLACRAMRSGARRSVDASLLKWLFRLSGCCRVAASLADFTTPEKRDETPKLEDTSWTRGHLLLHRSPLPEKNAIGIRLKRNKKIYVETTALSSGAQRRGRRKANKMCPSAMAAINKPDGDGGGGGDGRTCLHRSRPRWRPMGRTSRHGRSRRGS